VNCTAVRDRLPEHALGGLAVADAQTVDRHLVWCAACRKESGELERAAATFAFALAPTTPDPSLEDRVAGAVREVAGPRTQPQPGRRARLATAAAVAAVVAISGLGWGAVMAGRAARFQEEAAQAQARQEEALHRFADFVDEAAFADPKNEVFVGTLRAGGRAPGGGAALTLASPTSRDVAIVMLTGVRPSDEHPLPYRVSLLSDRRRTLTVGRIRALDEGGGAAISRQFDLDLASFTGVVVTDATGEVVVQGSVSPRATLATPSP
jgi:hypothetical protein